MRRTTRATNGIDRQSGSSVTPIDGATESDSSGTPNDQSSGVSASDFARTAIDSSASDIGGPEPAIIHGVEVIEPAAVSQFIPESGDAGAGTRSRRTRSDAGIPRGTRSTKTTAAPDSLKLEDLVFSLHFMVGRLVSEVELDREESKKLADAIAQVNDQYGATVNPKVAVWVNLCSVAGAVYGPRFMTYKLRKSLEEKPAGPRLAPMPPAKPNPQSVEFAPGQERPRPHVNGAAEPLAPSATWAEPAADFPGFPRE